MRVNLIGTIFGTSGYASHVKGLLNALSDLVEEIHLETPLPSNWLSLVNDAELRAIQAPHFDDGVTVMVGTPPYWNLGKNQPCKKFLGFVVWEGDMIPASWIEPLLEADGVLVPSQHVLDAIQKTFLSNGYKPLDKIGLVPHGVDTGSPLALQGTGL